MIYTVTGKPSVKQQLGEIWMSARDRKAVTVAADSIDSLLRENPLETGQSRCGNARILVVWPLAVVYEVHEADRLVQVLSIRHVPVRPSSGD